MKDHQVAALINDLRDIAIKYHGFGCLRGFIRDRLMPDIDSLRAQLAEANRKLQEEELLNLLAIMFDAYENGTDCYEDPEECGGYLGKAVMLDDETFHQIADILNERLAALSSKGEENG